MCRPTPTTSESGDHGVLCSDALHVTQGCARKPRRHEHTQLRPDWTTSTPSENGSFFQYILTQGTVLTYGDMCLQSRFQHPATATSYRPSTRESTSSEYRASLHSRHLSVSIPRTHFCMFHAPAAFHSTDQRFVPIRRVNSFWGTVPRITKWNGPHRGR